MQFEHALQRWKVALSMAQGDASKADLLMGRSKCYVGASPARARERGWAVGLTRSDTKCEQRGRRYVNRPDQRLATNTTLNPSADASRHFCALKFA